MSGARRAQRGVAPRGEAAPGDPALAPVSRAGRGFRGSLRAALVACSVLSLLVGCGDDTPLPEPTEEPRGAGLRVVSLGPNLTEFCFALGAGERLVGVTAHCDHPAAARQLPKVGSYDGIDVEAVLLLAPDLVLVPAEGLMQDAAEQLAALGVEVLPVHIDTLDALPEVATRLGEALDVAERGRVLGRELRARLEAVRATPTTRPSAVLVYGSEPLVVAGPGSFGASLLEAAGAANAFADAPLPYPRPGWDDVLVRAPTLVVLSAMDNDGRAAWERFPEIPAVRHGRLHGVDPDLLSRPGPRLLDGLEAVQALVLAVSEEAAEPAAGPP